MGCAAGMSLSSARSRQQICPVVPRPSGRAKSCSKPCNSARNKTENRAARFLQGRFLFHAYMPNPAYIFVPTREMWPAKSVNARIAPIAMKDARGEPVPDDEGKPKKNDGERVAGPAQAGGADDVGARPAGPGPRPPDLRRRVVRPWRRCNLQPVSPPAASLR
jgi:hypothetical protein